MLDNHVKLSIVIPAKRERDQPLRELLSSIKRQDFPKGQLEILVVTEGTSESAKAIGIRKAQGKVIGILATDNYFLNDMPDLLTRLYEGALEYGASYPTWYGVNKNMCALDRYFALVGGNDPLAYAMGKNDRASYLSGAARVHPGMTFGDNGFFVKKELIVQSDMDNYFHIDNVWDIRHLALPYAVSGAINHHSGEVGLLPFLMKRYRYGLQHAFNPKRRWHLVEKTPGDLWKLFLFVFGTLTVLCPTWLSIRGFLKVHDPAWFLHPIVSILTVLTYAVLTLHLGLRWLVRWLSAPWTGRRA